MSLKPRNLREKLVIPGWSTACLYWWCLRGAWWVLASTGTVAWGGLGDQKCVGQLPSTPSFFFHNKDGLFQWFASYSDSDSVLDFEVQEFLWSSLPYKKTFYMLNIYIFQYQVTLWNPFFENQSHRLKSSSVLHRLGQHQCLAVCQRRGWSSLGLKGVSLMAVHFWTSRCDCQKML